MNRLKRFWHWNNRLMGIQRPVIIRLLGLWVILCAGLISCKTESGASPWVQQDALTIGQYLQKNQEEYSKFYQLLVEAKMLQTLYAYNPKGGDWTLFLPTDEAIDQLVTQHPQYGNFEELVKDTLFIKKLTRYHILKKAVHTNEFPEGAFVDSTLTGGRLVASFFAINNDQLIKINHVAPIVTSNQQMTNGYVHIISQALQPAEISGYSWLQQQSKYSILAKAMELSGIKKKLTWEKYSIFAEPDSVYHRYGIHNVEELIDAIATPGQALTSKTNAFYQFASYHILKGEYYINDFYWGDHKYQTLSEQPTIIDVDQDVKINIGVDTYDTGISESGTQIKINYIRIIPESSNILTRTGPVHSICDLMHYTKLPEGITKDFSETSAKQRHGEVISNQ